MFGSSNNKNDSSADDDAMKFGEGNVGVCLRILFLALAAGGFGCSLACLGVCNFFVYEPRDPSSGIQDTRPDLLLNVTVATIGLFKYDSENEGCRDMPDDFDGLSGWFTAAQVGFSFTYDAFTKTSTILPVEQDEEAQENDVENEEGDEEDNIDVVEEEEVEAKKSLGQKIVAPVGAVGSAMGSAMKGVKDTVTGSKNKAPQEGTPTSGLGPEGTE